MPLIDGLNGEYPLIKDQILLDKKFIEKHLTDNCTLIDAGCGPGKVPLLFSNHEKVRKIVAFDASQDMVNKAIELCSRNANMSKISFSKENLLHISPKKHNNPVVTCMFGTLGGIVRKQDRITALKNLKAVAKGGVLLMSVFNNKNIQKAVEYYTAIGEVAAGLKMIKTPENTYFVNRKNNFFTTWYSRKGLEKELAEAGLNADVLTAGEQFYIACHQ